MNVAGIEELLIATLKGLGVFALVDSLGRNGEPDLINYPAALVYFAGDGEEQTFPRPVDQVEFHVQVRAANHASEAAAGRDAYTLTDLVRMAIRGKALGIASIEPFRCLGRELSDFRPEEGMIEYTCKFAARQYQPVVIE